MRSIPQVYLQEYCALLLLSMIQVRVTIAALSKHGGGELVKKSTTLFRGLLMPGSWWQTCSEAVKNLKFLGKLSSVHAALVSYLAARFHSCAVTVQAAA